LSTTNSYIRELSSRITRKPYLAQRIELYELTRFLTLLSEIAELVHLSSTPHPSVVRDAEDDYLIALAVAGKADILVTGDRDLLAIADLTPFRIMTLRAFADLLDQL
jgi:putative PIN family toxin of toxin-antitoxin system